MKFSIHCIFWLILTTASHAQDALPSLSPLIVEATRQSVIPEFFSGNATVIEEVVIANSGARSLAELLTSRAGVRITSTSGNTSDGVAHLRGFGENASSRVLILIDGRPVNRPDMEGSSLLEIPLSRIARVEVMRGSQTARFGDNAVGGVINIVTKYAKEPRTSMEIAGGSEAYELLRFSHDGCYAGNGIAFDFERKFADGWRMNSASELETTGVRWNREITKAVDLLAGFSCSNEYTEFPGPLSTKQYNQNPRQSIYVNAKKGAQYFSKRTTQKANAALELWKNSDVNFDIPTTFSSSDQSWNFGPGSHTDNTLETFTITPVMRCTWQNGSAELGVNFRQDDMSLLQFEEIQRQNKIGEASLQREVGEVFSTAAWEPWSGWHFNAAARWGYSQLDASAASLIFPDDPMLNFARGGSESNEAFQLGLRWEAQEGLALWLRADQFYRLPSTDEIAAYQGYPMSVPFNDKLTAETGQNFELGMEYALHGWTLGANGFLQYMKGEILYDYLKNLNVNFADTQRLGFESDVGYHAEIWEAGVHYAYVQARFIDGAYAGKDICLVPNDELSATLTLRPCAKITLQSEYQWVGPSYEGNDFRNAKEKMPDYSVVNLMLRYEARPGLSFYVRINNLLDEQYATLKYSGVWYPAAGRTYQCGMRFEF